MISSYVCVAVTALNAGLSDPRGIAELTGLAHLTARQAR